MLDFVKIKTATKLSRKNGVEEGTVTIFPEFLVKRTKDLMVRGGAFYAVWDDEKGAWSTDEMKVAYIVDAALQEKAEEYPSDVRIEMKRMLDFSSGKWSEFIKYCGTLSDNFHELDSSVVFANMKPKREDYCSKSLSYSLEVGKCESYDRLMSVLYSPEERQKIEWAIGAIFSGDGSKIQKFLVLYGPGGTGKSTVLNIIEMLFEDYVGIFDAKALVNNSSFALESFKGNPLVSIQHDGDLSKIEDNTKFNSIVSHEKMTVNEKYKSTYSAKFNSFLFLGTNKPVKITDSKSGIIRRLIDVKPTGNKVSFQEYQTLMHHIRFELGAIASRCMEVYSELGVSAYDAYRPMEMISATNDFFNFMLDSYEVFSANDSTTLKQAWSMYKEYSAESDMKFPYSQRVFKEELKNYFDEFYIQLRNSEGVHVRNLYQGFKRSMFEYVENLYSKGAPALTMLELKDVNEIGSSIFDSYCSQCRAQYATASGVPGKKWSEVSTTLSEIDTRKLHYVKVPENHIVIDFDLKDINGEKCLEKNLKAAARWPKTYSETSKSGKGVHLHYIYKGDVSKLANVYSENIEIKVFRGKSSLRRQLTMCNDIPIAEISGGLPLKKEDKKVVNFEGIRNEKALRTLIEKNLRKECHPGTKPSVDFIEKILGEAYDSGMHYDVTDMRPRVMAFANNSTHHALECIKKVGKMQFHSEDTAPSLEWDDETIIFYDVEIFPNLFLVVYKPQDGECVKLVNPSSAAIEALARNKLIGFNNRRYDNHILYARILGYEIEDLYGLSQKIINGSKNAMFREAYNLSYADIYDFCSKKQSLKKWEIELGIHHQELGLPWDMPVDEDKWDEVAAYCVNDVIATQAVFEARQADFKARELLADLSGLSVNDTTRMHATKIIFGGDKHPQDKFVYTDLSTIFPGYKFEAGKSTYRGENPSEGGYVYSEPGMYKNVALLDIESMHPTSIEQLNLFGPYTKKFSDIKKARLAIKHGDYETAKTMLDGRLERYLGSDQEASDLSYALKIIINSVYGYTSARFECEFKDPRNIDNIVAKRGALFMIDLKNAVQERGYSVAHIKTDSIKIPEADQEIIDFITEFGSKYGYRFEHEATYDRLCLVNDAVYICHDESGWHATGTQFAVPYVFKTLFSGAEIEFDDLCETKSVTGTSSLYLNMNEKLPEGIDDYIFVGRAGRFTPIMKGRGGGLLMREKDGKYYAVVGTKGYRWLESEMVVKLGKEDDVDISYYEELCQKARDTIEQYGSFEDFVKE